jgi:hypothetical protein
MAPVPDDDDRPSPSGETGGAGGAGGPGGDSRDDDAAPESPVRPNEEEPRARTGRFHVPHRGGTRVEVGEPIRVGGDRPWMCAVKLVGRKRDPTEDPEPTQTLLVRTGRGVTAEDARRDALAQLTLVYGSPVEPPPAPIISQKPSDPPPSQSATPTVPPSSPRKDASTKPVGWWARLFGRKK